MGSFCLYQLWLELAAVAAETAAIVANSAASMAEIVLVAADTEVTSGASMVHMAAYISRCGRETEEKKPKPDCGSTFVKGYFHILW